MEKFIPKIRFMVTSDIHYQDEHTPQRDYFEKAVGLAYNYASSHEAYNKLDALFVVGDFSNTGTQIQMQAFKDSIDKTVKPETEVVVSVARHEFLNDGEEVAYKRFKRIFDMDHDVHKVINDFHFISVSTTNGDRFDGEKWEFASLALEAAFKDDPKKPIFFFQHPHIRDTVYGSLAWSNDDLMTLLMNYPQVIDFSGHSHAPINDPRSIHQKHFTAVGTGTMFYFELDEYDKIYGAIPPNKDRNKSHQVDAAQILIVEVDESGCVRILPYDVVTEQFFPLEWEIKKPWDPSTFLYTDERYNNPKKPYFKESAKINITDLTEESVEFIFDQATIDEEYVNGYDITIKRKKDDVILQKISIFSEYYYLEMPEKLSQKFDLLEKATEYILSITANSFWKTSSDEALEINFITLER